jgi:hypothetical protein
VGQTRCCYGVVKEYALNFENDQERDHDNKFCILWLHYQKLIIRILNKWMNSVIVCYVLEQQTAGLGIACVQPANCAPRVG